MAMDELRIPYPDFKMGDIIDPEQHDLNNGYIQQKTNELVEFVNSLLVGQGAFDLKVVPPDPFTAESMQGLFNEITERLQDVRKDVSGGKLIGVPSLVKIMGNTVEDQLKSIDDLLQTTFVTTSYIRDLAVTERKLADLSVGRGKIKSEAITIDKLHPTLRQNLPEWMISAELEAHIKDNSLKHHIRHVASVPSDLTNEGVFFKVDGTTGDIPDVVSLADLSEQLEQTDEDLKSRAINAKFPPPPLLPIVGNNVFDDSDRLQAIINLGKPVYVPPCNVKITKKILLRNSNFIGSGFDTVFTMFGSDDAFQLPISVGRKITEISNFTIRGEGDVSEYAAITSADTNNLQEWSNSFKLNKISIIGAFGAGMLLRNSFRLDISEIGITNCHNGIAIIGHAVQTTIDAVTSNNDNPLSSSNILVDKVPSNFFLYPNSKTMGYGLLVCGKFISGSYRNPESIKATNCSFVNHDVGLAQYDALYSVYDKMDLDYAKFSAVAFRGSNGGCTLTNSWLALSVGAKYGIYVQPSTVEYKALSVHDVTIHAYGELNDGCAINSVSDGVVTPYRFGGNFENITVETSYFEKALHFLRCRDFTLKNFVVKGTTLNTDSVLIDTCERFTIDNVSVNNARKIKLINNIVNFTAKNINTAQMVQTNTAKATIDQSDVFALRNKPLEVTSQNTNSIDARIILNGGSIWTYANKIYFKSGTAAPTSISDGLPLYAIEGIPSEGHVVKWVGGKATWTTP